MALKVSSWAKNGKEEVIPTCQVNDILNVNIEDENYEDLEYHDDVDLGLCWEYFDKNYKCCCLEPKYDGTVENCLQLKYALYFFQTGGKLSRRRKNF